jgi:hypothetical protein
MTRGGVGGAVARRRLMIARPIPLFAPVMAMILGVLDIL